MVGVCREKQKEGWGNNKKILERRKILYHMIDGFVLKDFTANYCHIEVHKQQDDTNCKKYNTREKNRERERERARERG